MVKNSENLPAPTWWELSEKDKAALKAAVPGARDLNDYEIATWVEICRQYDIAPLSKQITPVRYGDAVDHTITVQALTALANRTGEYQGTAYSRLRVRTADKRVVTIHLEDYDPEEHIEIISATVAVRRSTFPEPEPFTAHWASYAKYYKNKHSGKMELNSFWATMPQTMLTKCAKAGALRSAFPDLVPKAYISEELDPDRHGRPSVKVEIKPVKPAPATEQPQVEAIDAEIVNEEPTEYQASKDQFDRVIAYYRGKGGYANSIDKISAMILARFEKDRPELIPNALEIRTYAANELRKDMKKAGILPDKGEGK